MDTTINRNVYLYWVGKEYKLIEILRNIIYLHSKSGNGYNVIFINHDNIRDYISNIPECFWKLSLAHQADFVRVNVIHDYGGIWLDSDTLVMESLDSLFEILNIKEGFLIKECNKTLCNGVFGSKAGTDLMKKWKEDMYNILNKKKTKIGWTEIGGAILNTLNKSNPSLFNNYEIFNGLDNIYPVTWNHCVNEYLTKKYDNCHNIEREFQPLIVLVNSVYKEMENMTINDIFNGNKPVTYFINKSFDNMDLIDHNFIEIGTSNFDTLIQTCNDDEIGISVDAVKYYIDQLPEKTNVKKINVGISDSNSTLDVYYIPEDVIEKNRLQKWFKGCNCIGRYHPLHVKHNVKHLCQIDTVDVITPAKLFIDNQVKNVGYLKIDTEGHDCIILKSLYSYIKFLPKYFYPNKILFETNENAVKEDVDEVLILFNNLGYKIISRGYDTIIEFIE